MAQSKKRVAKSKTVRPKAFKKKVPSLTNKMKVNPRPSEDVIHGLPFSYGETKLVLMVRDPYWAYSYWDFSAETWNWIQQKLHEDLSLKPLLRVYDLTAKNSFDLLISLEVKNWYIHLGSPRHRYLAELGMGDGKSRFILIARSNEVETPPDAPSDVIDPEWYSKDLDELYRLFDITRATSPSPSSPGSHSFPRKP